VRKEIAVRVYHEWMPTRSGVFGEPGYIGENIYRRFDMGDLATIQCLETRVTVCSPPTSCSLQGTMPRVCMSHVCFKYAGC
jgi:phosphodiesterase/alkaline phosphatase D-like protein